MAERPAGKKSKIFVVSAPSGCGKTTLCAKLLDDMPELANSISVTTRRPRPGEKNGVDYHFVSKNRFAEMVKKGAFLEHEDNFGNRYGTPKTFVEKNLEKGRPALLSIDVKGAMKVRKAHPAESVLIFVLPPSISVLKKRLYKRKSDGAREISGRLALAKKELSYKNRYDYRIVNDRLDRAYAKLKKIVTDELKFEGE